ncbi:hypothetical protein SUDANB105_07664 [Streptomyces sp. enrichment culture]|uniref:hypothetical protein n=1 Tax=Streptomyces sp. enrichment culture TaxID=1795815 RepID=UPI003F54AE2F
MSTLSLLVLMLATVVALLLLSTLAYLPYRHPRLAAPLGVAGTFAAVLVAVGALITARGPTLPRRPRPPTNLAGSQPQAAQLTVSGARTL